ncbi:MAG: hypothetical protein H0V04_09105 [Chloroflexi bacterium]|nr:hypothetical protein [Chloroflexota bacterium]
MSLPDALDRFASFQAELHLRPAADGGRHRPVVPGYRPTAVLDGELHDVAIYFEGAEVAPGGSVVARVIPVRIDRWRALFVGERIEVREGTRTVGELVVASIEGMP